MLVFYVWTHYYAQATSKVCNKQPLKLPARQIPWNTGNTYTQSPILFADTVSLRPSHKMNVPPNRKAILQCITLSERTSAPQPVSLNLSLICLVLLWALRNNYHYQVVSAPPAQRGTTLWFGDNVRGRKCELMVKSDFVVLLPARADAAVSSLSFGLFKHKEIQHCNMNLWPARCFLLSERHR